MRINQWIHVKRSLKKRNSEFRSISTINEFFSFFFKVFKKIPGIGKKRAQLIVEGINNCYRQG